VHAAAGFSGLAAAIVIGKRQDFKVGQAIASHNIPFVLLGAGILWFGWLGFNGGSALSASPLAVNALVVTNTSGAAGALVWLILSWAENKKPSAMATAIGAVCGLIAITPASGYVGPMSSIAIGTIAGIVTYLALHVRSKYLAIDDTLDVWAAHGMGGVTGIILAGVFAEKGINPTAETGGLLFGNPGQLGVQVLAAVVTLVFAFVMTLVLFAVLAPLGLRVSKQEEEKGLDLAVHGEEGYGLVISQEEQERLAQIESDTSDLRTRLQSETAELRMRLQSETGELRMHLQNETGQLQRLQSETSGLRLRWQEERIAHLEVENQELRNQLDESKSSDPFQRQESFTSLRSYKQFVVPSPTRKLV
jgi:hypothetical protein